MSAEALAEATNEECHKKFVNFRSLAGLLILVIDLHKPFGRQSRSLNGFECVSKRVGMHTRHQCTRSLERVTIKSA